MLHIAQKLRPRKRTHNFFIKGIDQSKVDKTTECWLEKIKERLTYQKWLAGHYHCEIEKSDNIEILYYSIKEF